jgi:uncharacterized protein (TIGR03067 family)
MSRNIFRFVIGYILIAATICIADAKPSEDAKKDLAQLQGTWHMVSGQRGGQPFPEEFVKSGQRVCKESEVTVTFGGQLLMKATIKLDPAKEPKTIDYAITEGASKDKTQLGIYELKDDTIKFCFSTPGSDRPTSFETKAGDGRTLSVWKKEK